MTKHFTSWWLIAILVFMMGCTEAVEPTPTPTSQPIIAVADATREPAATLVPTFTPIPKASPLPTSTASGEPTPAEPSDQATASEDFDEIIVDLRYEVPATGLARRLQGNRANRITFVDETSGQATAYSNQGGVLLELRQALSDLELKTVPAGCDNCVKIQYELSIEAKRGEGWLQDPVLLASIENFMSIALGPHFPPQTTLGLRRSASPYAPAHTLALTEAGELWVWLGIDNQVSSPTTTITNTQPLQDRLQTLSIADLESEYVVACEGSPVETLYLNPSDEQLSVSIVCPEYSLPSVLLPLYLFLDEALQTRLAEVALERPPAAFPLAALLDYRRVDGTRLTLFRDGQIVMLDSESATYTGTLSMTQVVSLTESLWNSGILQPGLNTFGVGATATVTPSIATAEPQPTSVMVLRGPDGLYDAEWTETPELPALMELDAILDERLGLIDSDIELRDDTPTPEGAQIAGEEGTVTPTPTSTPTPQATATP